MIRAGGSSDAREQIVETIRDFLEDVPPELLKSTYQQLQEDLRELHRAIARKKVSCVLCGQIDPDEIMHTRLRRQVKDGRLRYRRQTVEKLVCESCFSAYGIERLLQEQAEEDLRRIEEEQEAIDELYRGERPCRVCVEVWNQIGHTIEQETLDLPRLPQDGELLPVGEITCRVKSVTVENPRSTAYVAWVIAEQV